MVYFVIIVLIIFVPLIIRDIKDRPRSKRWEEEQHQKKLHYYKMYKIYSEACGMSVKDILVSNPSISESSIPFILECEKECPEVLEKGEDINIINRIKAYKYESLLYAIYLPYCIYRGSREFDFYLSSTYLFKQFDDKFFRREHPVLLHELSSNQQIIDEFVKLNLIINDDPNFPTYYRLGPTLTTYVNLVSEYDWSIDKMKYPKKILSLSHDCIETGAVRFPIDIYKFSECLEDFIKRHNGITEINIFGETIHIKFGDELYIRQDKNSIGINNLEELFSERYQFYVYPSEGKIYREYKLIGIHPTNR